MSILEKLSASLPEVKGPSQRRLSFKEKLKWTLIVLVLYFILALVPLYGLGENALAQFEFLRVVLASPFGSIISLGIGPIVTASIVLQLLNGAQIVKFDLKSPQGRSKFQSTQKLLALFFVIFEAFIYVFMGGLAPANALKGTPVYLELQLILVFQLILGGILIMFMDEVISKWGFGSGISLFIAAGVSQQIFVSAFNWLPSPSNPDIAIGAVPSLIQSISSGDPTTAALQFSKIASTVLVFLVVVYAQSMKVEIPLSFGKVRGYGMRWPLKFFYTSNIPVILIAALLANIQIGAQLLGWGTPGFVSPQGIPLIALTTGASGILGQLPNWLGYTAIMTVGSIIFAIFWMQTANMDAKSQAENIMSSGLQIPGFRRDPRVLESVLSRYIWPLTILGGAAVGLLAALADLTGSLASGTGILLAVMIVYNLYEEIAKQHMMDMHPLMRNFIE